MTEKVKEQASDIYKTSRVLYVIEAALEYFISLLVTGAYLAKITSAIGMSDTVTGILTSFVSLGFGFQIIAVFLANKRPVKRWVTILHCLNQTAFALIYFIPIIHLTQEAKTILFIAFLLTGHILNNVVNSPKINWFMSLVEDKKRGRFTANKEMVSLIGGMIFSFITGSVIDKMEGAGDVNGAFIVCGVSIFVLMLLHSLTLIFSKEKPVEESEKVSVKLLLKELITDKNLFKVILLSVLWNVVNYASTPFYGSYQIKELGFSMTFVSILSAAYAIVRTIFSRPMGKFADKYSFARMLNICFGIALAGFVVNVFTVPENGKVFYTIYYMLYAISMAGINSATINLIFDYVEKGKRTGALALKSTVCGFAGFLTTLIVSPLVGYVQQNNNELFGLPVYAQQVTSLISAVTLVVLIIYLNTVIRRIKGNENN
ncbi:MAG: MFS transporter [Candidatus Borkfalkiaceae bacterium]|nr:MFS transporter [Christensenellaceae bacterium]